LRIDNLERTTAKHGELALCVGWAQLLHENKKQEREVRNRKRDDSSLGLHGRLQAGAGVDGSASPKAQSPSPVPAVYEKAYVPIQPR